MPNTLLKHPYLCPIANRLILMNMKKINAFSSLLLLGGLGSLGYLTAKLADLNLTFSLRGEEDHHYL
jgi:hypothetical protein